MTSFIMPGEKAPQKVIGARQDAAYEEAKAARHRRRARDKQLTWDATVDRLKKMTSSTAAETIRALPAAQAEMYLLAEEVGLARREVLELFPAPGPHTRATWAEFATPAAPERASKSKQRN